MLSQSEAPDFSNKEMLCLIMTLAQCTMGLLNDAMGDTTGVDSSNLLVT